MNENEQTLGESFDPAPDKPEGVSSLGAANYAASGSEPAGPVARFAKLPAQTGVWVERIVKGAILAAFALAPFLALPFTQDTLFAKTIFVEIVAVVAGALWLVSIIVERRISYKRLPLNAAFLGMALVLLAATVFSRSPWASFWGSDPTGEKTASFLAFIIIAFVTSAVFRRDDVIRGVAALLVGLAVLGAVTIISVLAGRAGTELPAWFPANPVGTTNALAYVLAASAVFGLGLLVARTTSAGRKMISGRLALLALVCVVAAAFPLLAIGFRFVWIGIAAVAVLLIVLNFVRSWPFGTASLDPTRDRQDRPAIFSPGETQLGDSGGAEYALTTVSSAVLAFVLVASAFFAFRGVPFVSQYFQPPLEVSPSFQGTVGIARQALKAEPVLGFGPANFRLAYNQFRDPSLNSTIFWATRFSHGFSYIITALATVGGLGVLALLGFVALAATTILRGFLRAEEPDALRFGLGVGALFILLMWFLYAANFTASFLLFAFLGLYGALLQEPRTEQGSWWRASRRGIVIEAPALNFLVSLTVVFGVAFSLVALYGLSAHYAAEVYVRRAAIVLNQFGNTDTARVFLGRATALNPVAEGYYQGQVQVALVSIQRIINEAAANPGADVSARFRQELSDAIASSQRATALSPDDPQGWFLLGQLYETVLPFLAGADKAALDAYARAGSLDPPNPALPFLRGRAELTQADLLTLQVNQTSSGDERSQIEALRNSAVVDAKAELLRSVALKPDYAQANFLLAQIAIRENNLQEAIRRTEATARAAQDIGVFFQLGVLYYRAGDFNGAKAAFEAALLLNDNYSNARYFLGLIWDQRGDRDGALSQFVKIQRLNPDNEEVKLIIANLEKGRPALDKIVPPATAPERRREAPVREEAPAQPLRRR